MSALLAAACSSGPRPIRFGQDKCEFCLMGNAEERFAAELVTRTGKTHIFDSAECLAGFVAFPLQHEATRSLWVTDYESPPRLIDARRAFFLESGGISSPMGLGIAAFASREARDAARQRLGGHDLDWNGLLEAVRLAWPNGSPHGLAHAADAMQAMPGMNAMQSPPRVHSAAQAVARYPEPASLRTESLPARAPTLAELVARAAPGERVVLPAGVYREPTVVIDKPLELLGNGDAVLDAENSRALLLVQADNVTIRGLVLRNIGTTYTEDRAAIRVQQSRNCRIEQNRIENGFFGIYLANVSDCVVRHNTLSANATRESAAGNGIHLWHARRVTLEDNTVRGFRDGIYFEFTKDSRVHGNISEHNLRYGLHFMFSDSCHYVRNSFRANGAGVAVMYTHFVEMTGNEFADNRGSSTYGLLLKEIRDSRITGNTFTGNSVALYAEGSDRLTVADNDFRANGWALKLMANAENNRFTGNNFIGNTFDVATNSRANYSLFQGNYWDRYRGYDLDHDGTGDSPERPVRLFSVLVERNAPSLILLRSFLVRLLDAAEAVVPALTPATLVDARPLMRAAVRRPLARSGS